MSRSIILREALDQIILGNIDSKTIADKFSDLSREEFDKLMYEALFDIWIVSGDKGYFSKGYHTAVRSLETCLFGEPDKKQEEHEFNEQWHDMLYF